MTTLTPEALDQAAARIAPAQLSRSEQREWERLSGAGFQRTAPASRDARKLLGGKTVDELIREAGITEHGRRPEIEIRMPGRLGGMLPGRMNRNRRDLSHPPSTVLYAAAKVIEDWGWQAKPHHLRDRRGRRCICGAICAAHDLGVGGIDAAHGAALHVLMTLREQHRWPRLIGDWNQQHGRTQAQALDIVWGARARALAAGQ
jgi:hypothetical protein